MQNLYFPERDFVTEEMQINFDMLGTLMLHWIRGHVYGTHIVAIYHSGSSRRAMKLK